MNTYSDLENLLHPRVHKHCIKLFQDGHWKHAAHESMIQVELALKEKSGEKKKYGVNLIKCLFGQEKGIKLRIPFDDSLRPYAEKMFDGAFTYYRNYTAHDGTKVDQKSSLRIMILASELLDLIGASEKSFADAGGVEGLIKNGVFNNGDELKRLLKYLSVSTIEDDICDGYFEGLAEEGFDEDQVQAVLDVGLVEFVTEPYKGKIDIINDPSPPDTISWFEVSATGKIILKENRDGS